MGATGGLPPNITFYISNNMIKTKYVLSSLLAAHELAVLTLKLARRAFYRQYRVVEDQIGLTHGVIGGV